MIKDPGVLRLAPFEWDLIEEARHLDAAEPAWMISYSPSQRRLVSIAMWPAPHGGLIIYGADPEMLHTAMRAAEHEHCRTARRRRDGQGTRQDAVRGGDQTPASSPPRPWPSRQPHPEPQ